ncbi:C45 family autoproteolytic acyltransferase/hydolase [Nannocystis radixulma]|uniref:C45 family autoproteolytic acyltransferase/hydrolase n=1 Tax=Nannocystis radixulma TaxID=2995305 RepID=A0ABT5BME3_9BACT|nr:C45 family peptidase [Nannocystis radixulma]MDC0675267.1 C45 family autoproteolytic acyltransferase/hydrolase [Nannocystis radixulma]
MTTSTSFDPVLFEQDDPARRGEAHGEMWRAEIRELAELRAALALKKGSFADRAQLDAIARLHLPLLDNFSAPLAAELRGIARGAAVAPEAVVILNHYTDLRDVPPSVLEGPCPEDPVVSDILHDLNTADDPGGCTAVYLPGQGTPVLGQTWDMHGTAEPYVRAIRIRPRSNDDELVCFTLTGCLGMTGVSAQGVAVTINNLSSTDGQVGVVWPALVRAMLACASAREARDLLLRTRLSSGHHYMIADGRDFFGVETSGQLKVVTQHGARAAHIHTNHCFDPVLRRHEAVPKASTSFRRMELATTLYVQQRPQDAPALWTMLSSHEGYPRSVCSHIDDAGGDPSASKTCGRMIVDLTRGEVLVGRGCGQVEPPTVVKLDRWRGGHVP